MGVALAAMALQMPSRPNPLPLVVASRRVDFHLKRHAFSRWKYRQVDVFIAASNVIAGMLAADGMPARSHHDRARRRQPRLDRQAARRRCARDVLAAARRARRRQRRGARAAQGPEASGRGRGEGAPRGARRARSHRRRGRAARAARAADQGPRPRASRVPDRISRRRARPDEVVRPLRDELDHRRARVGDARGDGVPPRDRRHARGRHSRKSSSTARRACSCRRTTTARSPPRSSGCCATRACARRSATPGGSGSRTSSAWSGW